jgi:hypothetical protein
MGDGGMATASGKVPEELILGLTRGEWPIQVWESATHAIHWVGQDPAKRRLWRVRVEVLAQLQYVPPGEASLVEREPYGATD